MSKCWGGFLVWGCAVAIPLACGGSSEPAPEAPQACASSDCGGEGGAPEAAEAGSAGSLAGAGSTGGTAVAGEGAGGAAGEAPGCVPGERSCDGPSVRVCNSSGSELIETTCQLSQVCRDGACQDIVCVPGTLFCEGNAVRECEAGGTDSGEVEDCGFGSYCAETERDVGCSLTACEPGEALCNGDLLTKCAADGSGPKPGGMDCSASGRVCQDGSCRNKLCTPGERLCQHDDVYVCSVNGASLELFADCTSGEVCDPVLASCRPQLCEPGKLSCDSSRVVSCNAVGTGWQQLGKDCAESNAVCVEGTCKPRICTPGVSFCQDGDVYTCDILGVSAGVSSDCVAGLQHCVAYGGSYAYCASNACVPGAPVCNGNAVSVCDAQGAGPVAGGTDCGAEKVCRSGVCQPKVCDYYSTFCKDGDIHLCQDSTSSAVYQDCGAQARCVATPSSIACEPYPCQPGETGCLANVVGTCSTNGESVTGALTDCAASVKVCTLAGACAAEANETLGQAEELASQNAGRFVGNVINVFSDRTLTEIQANLVLAGPRDLHFAVYEYKAPSATRISEVVVASQSGSKYFSSGAMSVSLKAGGQYLIGVSASNGGFVSYFDEEPWAPRVSFGRVLGGMNDAYSPNIYGYYFSASFIYGLELTTTAP